MNRASGTSLAVNYYWIIYSFCNLLIPKFEQRLATSQQKQVAQNIRYFFKFFINVPLIMSK